MTDGQLRAASWRSLGTARRVVAATALAAVLAGGAVALTAPADALPGAHSATPPPNPTDAALQAAAHDKTKLAALVGQINGQIATNRVALSQAQGALQLAEQKMALRISQEQQAQAAAARAKAASTAAAARTEVARRSFVQFVQASYYGDDGGSGVSGGALLTSTDPSDLLARSSLLAYQARNRTAAVAQMQTAQVAQSNADAEARRAQVSAQKASAAAKTAVADAASLYRNYRTQSANLQASLSSQQTLLTKAQTQLATLNGQRATYVTYVKHQQYLAHQAYLKRLAQQREEAQQAERERERRRNQNNGGGGSSSGGGGGSSWSPPPPSGGSWTPAKGRKAANRALSELGLMYAWAGGNQYGPTRGVCAGDGAWNDCNVTGFDCSGLAMYAWGQGWDHYAATQYSQAGSYHPSDGDLMPGDLLFWSNDGTVGGIHHVAIYIGGGRMVEAPESGVAIRTANIYEYGSISFTTRPLT